MIMLLTALIVMVGTAVVAWYIVLGFLPRARLHISEIRFLPVNEDRQPYNVIFENVGELSAKNGQRQAISEFAIWNSCVKVCDVAEKLIHAY